MQVFPEVGSDHETPPTPLRKYWSPKKGSSGWKLTFRQPVLPQVHQHASPSPNKSPNMQGDPLKREPFL